VDLKTVVSGHKWRRGNAAVHCSVAFAAFAFRNRAPLGPNICFPGGGMKGGRVDG
jgi:hypothetical protein